MPPSGPTLEQLIRRTREALAITSDSPDLEARRLAEMATGLSDTRLVIEARRIASATEQAAFESALRRRQSGEPLAYITGHAGFHAIELTVNASVLIPRPETELLVDATLHCLRNHASARVADLGTGSGAIALALAHARPQWQLTAIDAHADALACARDNAQRLATPNIQFRQGHWLQPVAGQYFDAIVANPPYIDGVDPHLSAPALQHEPRHALVAADRGLAAIRQIVQTAPERLSPAGWLLLEHGYDQAGAVHDMLTAAGLHQVMTQHDPGGQPRITLGQRVCDTPNNIPG